MSRMPEQAGEELPRRSPKRIVSPTSMGMLDPKEHIPDQPSQLVLDPEDHEKNVINPLLAKKPTAKRNEQLYKEIKAVRLSKLGQPNPLERRGR